MSTSYVAPGSATPIYSVFGRVLSISGLQHEQAAVLIFDDVEPVPRVVSNRQAGNEAVAGLHDQLAQQRQSSAATVVSVAGEPRDCIVVPLRVESDVVGSIGFVAPSGVRYDDEDLKLAETLTETMVSIGFERTPAPDSHPPIDVSEEVLRELAQVLRVGDVFPRISAIVSRVLPHDRMTMTFHKTSGEVSLKQASRAANPEQEFATITADPRLLAQPVVYLPELTPEGLRDYEPREAREYLLRSGFLSFVAINVSARAQRMGVEFWSKRVHAFSPADIRVARTVANYLALAVSHEQLAEAEVVPEATPNRAAGFEARVRKLLDRIDPAERARRVVGDSPVWKPVLAAAARVAATDATVLLMGESGTGKEVLAQFIHAAGTRSRGPFVGVNCAALPEQLLESELFGHERGAFTGATHAKPGQIELATGGVLFLDEVSEMSLPAQAKFLRFLQEREFRRLGGTRLIRSDVQVIAATNIDLQAAIQKGDFRRDLYYRLHVVDIRLPALRERRDDIPLLAEALLAELAGRLGIAPPRVTPAAMSALVHYRWPGNVRELRNVLERAVILNDKGTIDVRDLSFDDDSHPVASSSTHIETVERDLIEKVLRECGGNKTLAARRLGLSRMQLYVRLRRYDITGESPN
jgi:DNA-binding NtrC family response regulator